MPGKPQLAIILPTNRWDALSRDVLIQAAAIGSDDILVHIGDNSLNAEKNAFVRDLAARSTNVVATCYETHTGPDENWQFLLAAQTAEYFCMAADDDCFTAGYFRAALDLIRSDPGCSAASGLHVSIAHPSVPVTTDTAEFTAAALTGATVGCERLESDARARIRAYRADNPMCYAVSKHEVIVDFFRFTRGNPLRCPFNDYILAVHLLSIGTNRVDRRGYVYLYDHTNWRLKDAFIANCRRWYKGYGMPDAFGYLTRLHMAVVSAHFFHSSFRSPDLSPTEACLIASDLYEWQRHEFMDEHRRYAAAIDPLFADHPAAKAALSRMMDAAYVSLSALFDDFALVVTVFSPEAARFYRAFQSDTLLISSERIAIAPRTEAPLAVLMRRLTKRLPGALARS